MANRFYVGGTANWDATAGSKWALTSGGAGGQAVPTSSDDVFLDGASGAVTVSVNTTVAICNNITFTGFTGTFNLLGDSIQVFGSIVLGSGMTMGPSPNGDWQMRGSGTQNITSNGKTFTTSGGPFYLLHTGTVVLLDALVTGSFISHNSGTFNANNQNVTSAAFVSSNTTSRTITMGSGTWLLTATGTTWDITDPTNLTLNANTSTIKITDTTGDIAFIGGSKTYNNIWFATGSNTGIITISGSNTFADLQDTGTSNHTIKFTDGTTQTVTSLTIAAGAQRTLTGTSTGGWTISDSTGTNSVFNCTISYSTASGGATWSALTTNGNVDGGNNSGWVFSSHITSPFPSHYRV